MYTDYSPVLQRDADARAHGAARGRFGVTAATATGRSGRGGWQPCSHTIPFPLVHAARPPTMICHARTTRRCDRSVTRSVEPSLRAGAHEIDATVCSWLWLHGGDPPGTGPDRSFGALLGMQISLGRPIDLIPKT